MAGQARLREALNAGGPGQKEKGPPVADGTLTVTPDTPEALEWRTRRSFMDSAGASSSYLEDDAGPRPSSLYGKFTWKIENFSEISKRELRSTVFEVGSYKWYILVYPQGCDVCNHLSLFLCVADYDKLLPGWSHFSQFTIAVVNKDPKKSKYSDTLHRFCKKEHDWGWKKFMELSKVLEGFTVSNTLVIKAQVQVIRDRPSQPFRCLDAQYRRELVRVYLTNVETICRKFVEERREALARLRDDSAGLRAFVANLPGQQRQALASERGEVLLKGLVKRFFNEKEVTSTLVMDALFSGCKQLEEISRAAETRKGKKVKSGSNMVVSIDKSTFSLVGDTLALLDRAANECIQPAHDDKVTDPLAARNAQEGDESNKDCVERDERRLGELGRRTMEMYSMAHIFSELEAAYCEAESIKRQDALIKEEEEAGKREDARSAARAAAEREKKARKKERRRVKKEADQELLDKEEQQQSKADDSGAASRGEPLSSGPSNKHRQAEEQAAAEQAASHMASADARLEYSSAALVAEPADSSLDELTQAIAATTRGGEVGSTGRSPAGEEAGPSTSRADSLPSETPPHGRAESDDGLSSTDVTSSTLSVEDAPSASQLRERAESLAAEVDSLRSALARVQVEGAASRSELASTQAELQATKAVLAARDQELSVLHGRLASHLSTDAASHSAASATHANGHPPSSTSAPAANKSSITPPAINGMSNGTGSMGSDSADSSSQDLQARDSSQSSGRAPTTHAPAFPSSQPPIARASSTSEPPPGFMRPSHHQQQHSQKENGIAQSQSSSGSASAPHASSAPRAKAWQGDPPESLGLGSRGSSHWAAGAGAKDSAGQGKAGGQMQQDSRSSSGPATAPGRGRPAQQAEPAPGSAPKNVSSAPSMSRSKSKGLNGNAAAFVPSIPSNPNPIHSSAFSNGTSPAPPPPTNAPQPTANGNSPHGDAKKAVPSYRNAAAGVLGASSGKPHTTAAALNHQQQQQPPGGMASSPQRSQESTDAGVSTPPASPRVPARAAAGGRRAGYMPSSYGHSSASPSPQGHARRPEAAADSPGLDDFAHMGLITDLLD